MGIRELKTTYWVQYQSDNMIDPNEKTIFAIFFPNE